MTKFIFIENTFSVLSGTIQLFKEQQFFLFIIIAGFSVVVPLIKLGVLFKLLDMYESEVERKSGVLDKYLHWMHLYGKWSMLDVFVVAVLVVAVKLGAIASVEMRYGLYFFAAAVLLMMILTAKVVSLQGDASR
jgi:paraquat-inducible protein A